MNNVMIDLETMGNDSNAAIIAIGAVMFDPDQDILGETFYRVVSLEDSMRNGGTVSASTIMWWMGQSESARMAIASEEGKELHAVLGELFCWLHDATGCDLRNLRVWGNGAAFDNVILANAYRNAEMNVPWEFWNDRCYRTMKSMHPTITIERSGTHHNALDDAISQANHLMRIIHAMS